jgi:hypothetical protein
MIAIRPDRLPLLLFGLSLVAVYGAATVIVSRLAGWLIPADHHRVLDLVYYAAGLDLPAALRESATAILGPVAGTALAYEISLIWLALFGWRRRHDAPPESSFSYHRNSGYVHFAIAILIALVIETFAVHFLLRLWSPVAAWILTAISIYSGFWIVGDLQAARLRPIVSRPAPRAGALRPVATGEHDRPAD